MTLELRHPDGRPLELEPWQRVFINRLLDAVAAGEAELTGSIPIAPGLELDAEQLRELAAKAERLAP